VQSIAGDRATGHETKLEIRSRWVPLPPAGTAEHLESQGLHLLERSRLYSLRSAYTPEPCHLSVLADPRIEESRPAADDDGAYVDVFCLPGVTDAEGETAAAALRLTGLSDVRCEAGTRFRFASLPPMERRAAVERLIGNPIVHRFRWSDAEPLSAVQQESAPETPRVRVVALREAGDAELLRFSGVHHLALDLNEMRTVAAYFRTQGRAPTDVELQSIALTWSEHCSHKTFRATIELDRDGRTETIPGLLRTCLATPTATLNRPWVRSAFVDNAGVIALDGRHDLAFKVETHNHPAALEPYGGAHTGAGGVIRDVLAVSAEPIANTDVLCFGPWDLPADKVPAGAFHPSRTREDVVRGVADYGNNMGIPTVGGAVLYHPGYTANPLVFCGTLGIAPRDSHPREPLPGDVVVLLGGRTGRDGLHGATMSSGSLDRERAAGSAVQIGEPITEKIVRDVLPHLRDEGLYHAITDCGAGGLCSAVGEMAETLGVDLQLDRVSLKYQGLKPWEVWLSEAQERMVLAVPEASLPRVHQLCRSFGAEATRVGRFRGDGLLRLLDREECVGELTMEFLHGGRPETVLKARWRQPLAETQPTQSSRLDATSSLLALLSHPNIASKEDIIRRYDHEVGAATVVKPLAGNGGPSDAAVLQPTGSRQGVVIAHGINSLYGQIDPHAMAMLAVDEALRNLVAVGGSIDRTALLDNFCWGDVDDPEELGALVRATQGCRDAALAYGAPFICGKDSLRNTSEDGAGRHSIPRTLLISAMGVIPNARRTATMDLKAAGNNLYLLGLTKDELGASHYLSLLGVSGGAVPCVRPRETKRVMRRLTRAIREGLVRSCHDVSEGGLAVAAAEMVLAGGLGLEMNLDGVPGDASSLESLLFAESPGRFLVEVAAEREPAFEDLMDNAPFAKVGQVQEDHRFAVRHGAETCVDLTIDEIAAAWRGKAIESLTASYAAPTRPAAVGQAVEPALAAPRLKSHAGRASVRALVLAAPGVNCDPETVEACRAAGAAAESVHLNQLLDGQRRLLDYGFLVLAGGFSYGDHLGAGAMLATALRYQLLDDLRRFVDDGRPILGICNGFQILARLGFLGEVALIPNGSGRFQCRWVPIEIRPSPCPFLRDLHHMELPIANGEGRVVVPDEALDEILTLAPLRYRQNPNGSVADIAGVCNSRGNVFGLMPHPERYVTTLHHPRWQRGEPLPPLGLRLFENAVSYVRSEL